MPVADHTPGSRPPWWINPAWYSLLFLLPLFLLAVYSAGPYMLKLGQKVNNLTGENITLGVFSIGMFVLGCLPFTLTARKSTQTYDLEASAVNRALTITGTTSLLCYLIYFSSVIANPSLVINFLTGSSNAMYALRQAMEQIPGITSFMQADLPFFSLFSVVSMAGSRTIVSPANRRLCWILAVFIAFRAILGAERLALVEAAVAFALPRAAFSWRPGLLRGILPHLGILGVFGLFCVGEYFRSWQYYKMYYTDFFDFITVRFFGYFATSINNGAGLVSHYLPLYQPALTADGFYRLLKIFGAESNPGAELVNQYLLAYATPEFNAEGGLYLPYVDYGIFGGALYFLLMGLIGGWLYRAFLRKSPIAIMLYPAWFLALLDIIRVWIWGSSRLVPVVLVVLALSAGLRWRALPQTRTSPKEA